MKISLALGKAGTFSRQTAWGFFTANVALPGAGSLAAGRRAGYGQLALAALGTAVTMSFGIRFILWFAANKARMQDPDTDPVSAMTDLWLAARWALAGICLFVFSWLWALATSLSLLRAAKDTESRSVPPRL